MAEINNNFYMTSEAVDHMYKEESRLFSMLIWNIAEILAKRDNTTNTITSVINMETKANKVIEIKKHHVIRAVAILEGRLRGLINGYSV